LESQLYLPDFFSEIKKYLFPKMKIQDLLHSLVMTGTSLLEREFFFDDLTKKILLLEIYYRVFGNFIVDEQTYREKFFTNMKILIQEKILDSRLSEFNLKQLSQQLDSKKDEVFNYIGLETLKSRYLLTRSNVIYETPQFF
jgi:ribonucleoside-diphosphate reductase alpha chain